MKFSLFLFSTLFTLSQSVPFLRQSIKFSYAWMFHFGPEADEVPGPNNGNGTPDNYFPINVSNSYVCTNMYPDPDRFVIDDCQLSCAYDPSCYVFLVSETRRQCLHGGSNATCTKQPPEYAYIGGMTNSKSPIRTDYTYSQTTLPDSTGWVLVDAPHDGLAVVNNSYSPNLSPYHGYLPRVPLWYRKSFTIPSTWANNQGNLNIYITFEGVFHYTQIWINGVPLPNGIHTAGYTEFTVRIDNCSSLLWNNQPNILALRADSSYGSGHWVEGGGLYRNIYITAVNPVHFVHDGVYINPYVPSNVNLQNVPILVSAEIENLGTNSASAITVQFQLYNQQGTLLATNTTQAITLSNNNPTLLPSILYMDLSGTNALWSITSPTLYTSVITIYQNNNIVLDTYNMTVGFRSAQWNVSGFYLNNELIKLRGFSNHHTFGGVGAAMTSRIELFRVQMLRAMGGNIWRFSHNPYFRSTYMLHDLLGVTSWDENRDFGLVYSQEMHDMVKRDRNHPSIVIWSLCNEAECAATSIETGATFVDIAKNLDPHRATGCNSNFNDTLYEVVDVQGWSHRNNQTIEAFHQLYPNMPEVLSECCSCTSQRLPAASRGVPSCVPDQNSPGLLPYVAGSLGVWTSMDYAGESGEWPMVSSNFGQFDYSGLPKPQVYWYVINWLNLIPLNDPSRPNVLPNNPATARILNLLDQLSYDNNNNTVITAITSTNQAELFVDGKSQGLQTTSYLGMPVQWTVNAVSDNTPNVHATCNFPTDESNIQCRGLTNVPSANSANQCTQACCDAGDCAIWQYSDSKGCWISSSIPTDCPPTSGWVGGSRTVPPRILIHNATVIAKDDQGNSVATHTLIAPDLSSQWQIVLSLDVPSPITGTGNALYLDGEDIALVRASIMDSQNNLISTDNYNITFTITSGPGRVIGSGNGDPANKVTPSSPVIYTYGGLARAVVQVSVDCTSPNRDLLLQMDTNGNQRTTILPENQPCPTDSIVLQATADGNGQSITSASITIPVSGDIANSPYSVTSSQIVLNEVPYLTTFQG